MATKKTVKKAPAVVKATPEVQEVRNDGKYNKYPVYHGCLMFDDDNVFEIIKKGDLITISLNNEVIYPAAPVVPDYDFSGMLKQVITGTVSPDDLAGRANVVYFHGEMPVQQRGAGLVNLTSTAYGKKAYAFYKQVQSGNVVLSLSSVCDIFLNVEPADYAFYNRVSGQMPNVNVYCAFDAVSDETLTNWGLYGATMHYNTPFPTESEFLERYKDL